MLDNEKQEHEREVSQFIDFMGSVGGVYELIMMAILLVFGPYLHF